MNGKAEMSNHKEQPRMRATSFADPNASSKSSAVGGLRVFRKFITLSRPRAASLL